MKRMNLKRFLALAGAMALTLSLSACGGSKDNSNSDAGAAASDAGTAASDNASQGDESGNSDSEGKVYKVAIVKQMDHASLDEIADAICARLDEIADENGITIEYGEVYSGQDGNQDLLNQIGAQVIADKVDAIIPIASTAAKLMTVAAEDSETPVIFAAVSDPEQAELTGISYVTGTSDALNTNFILDMMLAQNPDVKTVGLLYSLSEDNSVKPIADAKAYLESKNIAYVEATANTTDEVISAVSTLQGRVDAIFTPTDNIIMKAELATAPTFIEMGVPHYTGADSFVRNGAFTTCGVNYTELGAYTADLAYQALTQGMDGMEDYYLMDGGIITVNTETAEALGIDYSVFNDMGEVVEVQTTED